ncbi:MAG: GNAT family N-acetyltransferase [Candidatus Delongbacteria bacterium]|jgi:ribosomal protein S18 acetylase RimI-like enzyme|nr:GNAT family N-acetyltransferase [Candidatus Delongbacteria bacterium]
MKLYKGTLNDLEKSITLLENIKLETGELFEKDSKENKLLNYYVIKKNTEQKGVLITCEVSNEIISFLSLDEDYNDSVLFADIRTNMINVLNRYQDREICLNFSGNSSHAINYFRNHGFKEDNGGTGYEYIYLTEKLKHSTVVLTDLKFHEFDKNLIAKYVDIENSAFKKLENGQKVVNDLSRHLKFLSELSNKNKFGSYSYKNEIIGVIYMYGENTIHTIGVGESFQGNGFGKQIIFDWMKKFYKINPDIEYFRLNVVVNNDDAIKFYNKIGFKNTGFYSEHTLVDKDKLLLG